MPPPPSDTHNGSGIFPCHWHFAFLPCPQIISSCVDAVNLAFPPPSILDALLNTIILSFFAPLHHPTVRSSLTYSSILDSLVHTLCLPSGLKQTFLLDVNFLPSPLLRFVIPLFNQRPRLIPFRSKIPDGTAACPKSRSAPFRFHVKQFQAKIPFLYFFLSGPILTQ